MATYDCNYVLIVQTEKLSVGIVRLPGSPEEYFGVL